MGTKDRGPLEGAADTIFEPSRLNDLQRSVVQTAQGGPNLVGIRHKFGIIRFVTLQNKTLLIAMDTGATQNVAFLLQGWTLVIMQPLDSRVSRNFGFSISRQ